MDDRDLIEAFVGHLQRHGYTDIKVDRCPDKENRNICDIDAIAGPFAIEHTSFDTLPEQRRNADWFLKVVGGIEREISKTLSYRLRIIIEYTAVKKGQDWDAIREGLMNWISNQTPHLADGRHVLNGVPGIPFNLVVKKVCDRPPGVFFYRFVPPDCALPTRIKTQFDRKAEILSKYKPDRTTALLVESGDVLMSEPLIQETILDAYPKGPPSGVDQIQRIIGSRSKNGWTG